MLHMVQKIFTYKDIETLKPFLDSFGKIMPAAATKLKAKEQRKLAKEVKRARHLAILPFTSK
jgi:small subunit ribosomal protein S18